MSLSWVLRLAMLAAPFAICWYGLKTCLRILWTDPDADRLERIRQIHDQSQRPRQERL